MPDTNSTEADSLLEGSKIEKAAQSALMMVVARLILPPMVLIAISVAGWFLAKQSDKLEQIGNTLNEAAQNSKLLRQEIDFRARNRDAELGAVNSRLTDHEGRLRSLERPRIQ